MAPRKKNITVKSLHTSPFGRKGEVITVNANDPRVARYLEVGVLAKHEPEPESEPEQDVLPLGDEDADVIEIETAPAED